MCTKMNIEHRCKKGKIRWRLQHEDRSSISQINVACRRKPKPQSGGNPAKGRRRISHSLSFPNLVPPLLPPLKQKRLLPLLLPTDQPPSTNLLRSPPSLPNGGGSVPPSLRRFGLVSHRCAVDRRGEREREWRVREATEEDQTVVVP